MGDFISKGKGKPQQGIREEFRLEVILLNLSLTNVLGDSRIKQSIVEKFFLSARKGETLSSNKNSGGIVVARK